MSTPENNPTPAGGGGGGGGTVDQGAAGASPWLVSESNSSAIKTAVESLDTKTPASPAQDRTTFGAPFAARIANAGASAFVTPIVAGDNVLADLRVFGNPVTDVNPLPISDAGGSLTVDGSVSISGTPTVTANAGTGTFAISAASLPLPTGAATSVLQGGGLPAALVGGRLDVNVGATAGLTDAQLRASPVPVSGSLTATISGAVDTELPTAAVLGDSLPASTSTTFVGAGLFAVSGSTWVRLRGSTDGLNIQGTAGEGVGATGNPLRVGGWDGGNVRTLTTDTGGRIKALQIRNLSTNGTSDAPTRFPSGGDFIASSSGVALIKATGGRLFSSNVIYKGVTASGLFLQRHNAASATTPTTATLIDVVPMDTTQKRISFNELAHDMCFPNGIKYVASTTEDTTTIATTESFVVAAWGA